MPSLEESALRAQAQRAGYTIRKSRGRSVHANDLGEYMLIGTDRNFVVLGERYNASLQQIAEYLERKEPPGQILRRLSRHGCGS